MNGYATQQIVDLVDNYPNLAIWIGSGLSMGVYPGWLAAVKELCSRCEVVPPPPPNATGPMLIAKASECRSANEEAYLAALNELFGSEPDGDRPEYGLLLELQVRLFVTTNFDPLLELAALDKYSIEREHVQYYPVLSPTKINNRQKTLIYLHGAARPNGEPDARNIVLAAEDFAEAYDLETGRAASFVMEVLSDCAILFVGCQLQEEEIKETMRRVDRVFANLAERGLASEPPPRVLLLGVPAGDTVNVTLGNRIQIVQYEYTTRARTELIEILEEVRRRCGSRVYRPFAPRGAHE